MVAVEPIVAGLVIAGIYATLGYVASGEPFKPAKFARTMVTALFVAVGLDFTVPLDVYSGAVAIPTLTVLVEKFFGVGLRLSK